VIRTDPLELMPVAKPSVGYAMMMMMMMTMMMVMMTRK
jgi:hypothetical protein